MVYTFILKFFLLNQQKKINFLGNKDSTDFLTCWFSNKCSDLSVEIYTHCINQDTVEMRNLEKKALLFWYFQVRPLSLIMSTLSFFTHKGDEQRILNKTILIVFEYQL